MRLLSQFALLRSVSASYGTPGGGGGDAPTMVSNTTYTNPNTNQSAWTIFTALDLTNCDCAVLLISCHDSGSVTETGGNGWTDLGQAGSLNVFYKRNPTATEEFAASDGSQRWTAILIRLSGVNANPTATFATGEPPSHDSGTTTEKLWIAAAGNDNDGGGDITSGPSGYTDFTKIKHVNFRGTTTAFALLESADQVVDPGAFSANDHSATIAVDGTAP